VRDERQFATPAELVAQIRHDVDATRARLQAVVS